MSEQIIEWASFRLKPNTRESELLEAADELQVNFLAKCPGFLGRDLVRAGDGSFADIVRWSSRDAADAAMASTGESQACARYFALMEIDETDPAAGPALYQHIRAFG
jgi:hypothetical protein